MKISGLQKTTLLDYPGHVAATIFLGGCNFRCPFCHNYNLVENENNGDDTSSLTKVQEKYYSEDEILAFLNKRADVLDGVCITGGEPTINVELYPFIKKIKEIKPNNKDALLVKLDTNGTNPEVIKTLIREELIDYIAMDIKASPEMYMQAIGYGENCDVSHSRVSFSKNDLLDRIQESINTIITSQTDYEFRTTIIKQYHDEESVKKIGMMIKGAKKHYLQSFVDSEYVKDHTLTAYDKQKLDKFRDIMAGYVDEAYIRGVD